MNLTTRCPSCGTAFRVQPVQLSARGGKVRCGKCSNVFDGVKALLADGAAQGEDAPAIDSEPSPQLGLFEVPKKLAGAGDAANEDAPVPEFLDEVVPPRRRIAWALAATLALVALVAQVVIHYRAEIAAIRPEVQPYLSSACAKLGCDMSLPRHLKLLIIESSELRSIASAEGVVEVSASFRNSSPLKQEFPSLVLTLTNSSEEILAVRVISPSEYLQDKSSALIHEGVLPGVVTEMRIYFDNSKLQAIGYKLALVYI